MHGCICAQTSAEPDGRHMPLAVVRSDSGGLQVIPMLSGDATDQTPPDLPSFLFKERIVYLVRIDHIPLAQKVQLSGAVGQSASRPFA